MGIFEFIIKSSDQPDTEDPKGVTFETPVMPREALLIAAKQVKPNLVSPALPVTPELAHWGIGPTLGTILGSTRTKRPEVGHRRVLIALRPAGDPQFQEAEIETFLILCAQGAAALENATLHTTLRETIHHLEVSQRALIQSEKMATVGRLMATIAHEINNPLQSVQNCLHLAGRTELPYY